jgi:hypothetical protein
MTVQSFRMFIEQPGDIAEHPLVLSLGDGERMGALGLYGVVGAWAARYAAKLGVVPAAVVTMHDGRGKLSGALVSAGLWSYDHDKATYRYVHWTEPLADPCALTGSPSA